MSKRKTVYAMDLGNGFTKRTINGRDVSIEPSIVAIHREGIGLPKGAVYDRVKVFDFREVYIGQDVVDGGFSPIPAVGDMARYSTNEFKEMLLGFIAKDFKEDVIIDLLVLGLPVNHYRKLKDDLVRLTKGRTVVKLNGSDVLINIQDTLVLAQPHGTYMHLMEKGKYDLDNSLSLVVDGGHGTLDVTELKGLNPLGFSGVTLGMVKAYIQIQSYLQTEYGDIRVVPHDVPEILGNGLLVAGERIDIKTLPKVREILDTHFNEIYVYLNERYNLKNYNHVIFTGGLSLVYKEWLKEIQNKNFVVLTNAQIANVLGYYSMGRAVTDNASAV